MRITALLLFLTPLALSAPASAQTPATTAADPAYAAFDEAVAEAKAAMMADPQQAHLKADVAAARARALPRSTRADIALVTAQWLQGEAYIFLNQPEAAAPIVEQALAQAARIAPDTKLYGDLLRSRGALNAMGGRVQAALADFHSAHRAFEKVGEVRSQAMALQDIGQIYWDAGDYQRTLDYYSQAGEIYTADPAFTLTSHNNRGEVLRKLGRYDEAEREYALALDGARKLRSPVLEVRVLSNLATVQIEHGKLDDASRTITSAMRLSQVGEAAGWRPAILAAAAKVAAKRGDLRGAAHLLDQVFAGTDLKSTSMQFVEFHQLAADVYEKLGQKDLALQHLKAFQRLDSEAQKLTATTGAQLMSAQFDSANQRVRISQLKQGQLERDIRIERFRSIVLIGLIAAIAIILALLGVGFWRIRRSRNEVRAANIVLGDTNLALEKALKAKTEFLATTSHEIRTPLNGILGMTQIMLTNRSVGAEVRDQIQVVHSAGETMRALVDDILDVAKMETGEIAVAREEVPLRRILEDAGRLWKGHADAKGLAFNVDVANAPALIRSDGARIRQIVFNLLSNSVKFTPQGEIDLVAHADNGELVIEVRDTGIGIPADQHELVFEAFHQVDGGTTRQFSGTGLGLAICRNLASALGGVISLESTVDRGSVFTVRLPLNQINSPGDRAEDAHRDAPTTLAQARVLMLEANAMTQGVFRSLLEPVTGKFDCADDAAAVMEALQAGRVDLLLIEAKSAAIDGMTPLESLRTLVEQAERAGLPVSILFAPSDDLPLGDVAMLGATQLILKPLGGSQLVATLKDAFPARPAPVTSCSEAA